MLFKQCVLGFLLALQALATDASTQISIQLTDRPTGPIQLAYYLGDKQYVKDTLTLDLEGRVTITEPLECGIWLLVFPPGNNYVEFLVDDDQQFSLRTTSKDPLSSMVVTGSAVNKAFFEYLNYIGAKREQVDTLEANGAPQSEIDRLDAEVSAYRSSLISQHKNDLYGIILQASQDPVIPQPPAGAASNWAFYYHRDHYFDAFDFENACLLRTPVLSQRTLRFLEKLTVQQADSLIVACDKLLALAQQNAEIFKWTLIYLVNKFAVTKVMCLDKVYVHLVENYYLTGAATWTDEETLGKMSDRARAMRASVCGSAAPNIDARDVDGAYRSLDSIRADYTILFFASVGSASSYEAVDAYETWKSFKDRGVAGYCVFIGSNEDEWKRWLSQQELSDWHHVRPEPASSFLDDFDLHSYPTLFLLDKNKRILAKRFAAADLHSLLSSYLGE